MSQSTMTSPSPVTVAILSDVHGNDRALAAVLTELATTPHDQVVIAGDHVWNGVRPGETLRRLRGLDAPMLLGNTDEYLWLPARHPDMPLMIAWTRERIGADGMAFLRGLPIPWRFAPPGGASPGDDLLVVHATPTDVDAELVLQPDPFGSHPVTPIDEARRLLGNARAGLIVSGHLHYPSAGTVDRQRLATVGSVGGSMDGNPDAAWALAHWDGLSWTLGHRRTAYDVEAAAAEIEREHPVPALGRVLAERLRQARWLPFP
jgi:predicted phosphodiesterase